jgi:L-methionine (R)-S-oxide reductase
VAEAFNNRVLADDKAARYAELALEVAAVLDGEGDRTARMATVAAMLHQAFAPRFFWTGFYVVDPAKGEELVVGPYQGTLGCLRIAFGRGVCGTAAATGEVQLVPDVHAFPGHIACDGRSRSEIVLPVCDPEGRLIAVLDVDSAEPDAFDAVDAEGLGRILAETFARAPMT